MQQKRHRLLIGGLLFAAMIMLACTLGSSVTPPPPSGDTQAAPTSTIPPIAPTSSQATNIPTPQIGVASPTPVTTTATLTATSTITASETMTPTDVTPTVTKPAPPPPSSGPLDFSVRLDNCRLDSSRAGGIFLKFKIAATGGNGVYRYYDEGKEVAAVYERPATKGGAVIISYRVTSSDGQSKDTKYFFKASDFNCP